MANPSGRIIESQPDWLTVSAHGEARAKDLLDLAVGLAKEEKARGNRQQKWRAMGYEGIHCGRVTYGQRDTAATELRLSGDAAAEWLHPATALADGVTRLDLAVTWQADQPMLELGPAAFVDALMLHKMHPHSALPWSVSDGEGGFTFYLGKRASEYHFRQYNKEAQERKQMGAAYDGRYDRAWRYELEMKASVPMAVVKKLKAAPDRAAFCQDYVWSYMAKHGLRPPFTATEPRKLVPGFRRASDETTKLNHLSKNVRPTVQWLVRQGRAADVRLALGLEDSNLPHSDF